MVIRYRQVALLVLMLSAAIPACSAVPPAPTAEPSSSAAFTTGVPRATPAGDLLAVREVVDGDTLKVLVGGEVRSVRVIGLDTPEVGPTGQAECFGKEASDHASQLLGGKRIRLTADPTQGDLDKYQRLLRYADREDGLDFALAMIAGGFAREYTYDKPYQRRAPYLAAQSEARARQLGFWAKATCDGGTTPAPVRPASGTPTGDRAGIAGFEAGRYVGQGNEWDCGDFASQAEAQLVLRADPTDPNKIDVDGDGIACEGNPPPTDTAKVRR